MREVESEVIEREERERELRVEREKGERERTPVLPPIKEKWPKLDLETLGPLYDGNPSTCGYLGAIWTP